MSNFEIYEELDNGLEWVKANCVICSPRYTKNPFLPQKKKNTKSVLSIMKNALTALHKSLFKR
jgi:hypothetical protein